MHIKPTWCCSSTLIGTKSVAQAWGTVGHDTVALIATSYLSDLAVDYFADILDGDELVDIATWADSYRYTAAGAWSAGMHYIDAEDNPPDTCHVTYPADCGTFYVIVMDGRYSTAHRHDALAFLVHFLGDITQPLHVDSLDGTGGNSIDVSYGSTDTNLHAAWDSSFVNEVAGGSTVTAARSWSSTLITAINSGTYASQKASWITCMDVASAAACALEWASDSNAYVCEVVVPDGADAIEGDDLSTGSYHTNAVATVKLQIAKGGYRLANWLNAIAEADS
ncbi:nuclease PA3 [Mucidula mucida]|nr:nuclease PA3 [Mucidula mucida]